MSNPPLFQAETLERYATDLLVRCGMPAADARLTAQALLQADLEGVETHGLSRLPNYIARLRAGLINPTPQIRAVRQVGATALLDADNAMGQVAATQAMQTAIDLARQFGTGWVGVRNSGHFGAASFYANMALAAGMIGVALSNTPPALAPTGGRQAALGTNPIGVAIPTGAPPPISIDLATSAIARGHITRAARDGRAIPPDWALDADGNPTTDAAAALKGSLLPMAGPKGYALALAIEALCGLMTGSPVGQAIPSFFDEWERPANVGHLCGAFNIAAFVEPAAFQQQADRLVADLKATPPAAGQPGVRIPGERRAAAAAQRRRAGVPLAAAAVQQLTALGAELGMPPLADS